MALNALGTGVPSSSSDERDEDADRAKRRKAISDMIDDMCGMEDGWFEGRGFAPDGAGLLWLNQQFQHHYVGTDLPLPFLCPIETGDVFGDWSLDRHVCGIEIDLTARTGSWFDVDRETHEGIDERILDLDSADGWQWLIDRLRGFVGES